MAQASSSSSSLKISVRPQTSAFFAGETFCCDIVFRNTRTVETNRSRAHSVDGKDATDAGIVLLPQRRRLIGAVPPPLPKQRTATTRGHAKSASMSVATSTSLGMGHPTSAPIPPSRVSSMPAGVRRVPSAPIAPTHPHSRKKSMAQIQADSLKEAFELEPDTEDPSFDASSDGEGSYTPGTPTSQSTNGSEQVLWSSVQLGGVAEINESLVKPADFENLKRRLVYGDSVQIGGGDLGALADALPDASWSSYLGRRGKMHSRTGSTLQDVQERTLQNRAVPTFTTPPSILAVDLTLAPGESKSYRFQLQLPVDLPPSYHGKSIKFSYTLELRLGKAGVTSPRKLTIPVRVYNHVSSAGLRPFFDLMNPVIWTKEQGSVQALDTAVPQVKGSSSSSSTKRLPWVERAERAELEKYTRHLLSTEASTTTEAIESAEAIAVPNTSCKAAVEGLARTSTKVSYDICKDGKIAAVLTLVRSTYRLGDTVIGVIYINEGGAKARIARVAATLETHEEVQPSIATLPAGRMARATRQIHGHHHESVLDKGRANFSIAIPNGAGPEFVTSGVKLLWVVRLSFLTISNTRAADTPLPPPHLCQGAKDGYARYHVALAGVPSLAGAETKLETVECAVPIIVLPNSTASAANHIHFHA